MDYTSRKSIRNWITQYGLECASDFELSMVGSSFFIGCFFGSFVLPRQADVIGRKPMFVLGLVLYIISLVGLLVSTNQYMLYALMALAGISETGRYYVAYVYAVEILPKRAQDMGGLTIFLLFATFKVMVCLFLMNDPSRSWRPLAHLAISMAILSLLGTLALLYESPRFLYSKKRFCEAQDALVYIQKTNNRHSKYSFVLDEQIRHCKWS